MTYDPVIRIGLEAFDWMFVLNALTPWLPCAGLILLAIAGILMMGSS